MLLISHASNVLNILINLIKIKIKRLFLKQNISEIER
jgi:hypothetical protein